MVCLVSASSILINPMISQQRTTGKSNNLKKWISENTYYKVFVGLACGKPGPIFFNLFFLWTMQKEICKCVIVHLGGRRQHGTC